MSRAGPPAAAPGFGRTPGRCAFRRVSLGSAARGAQPHHTHIPNSLTLRALPFRKRLFKRQKLADPTAHVLCFAQGWNQPAPPPSCPHLLLSPCPGHATPDPEDDPKMPNSCCAGIRSCCSPGAHTPNTWGSSVSAVSLLHVELHPAPLSHSGPPSRQEATWQLQASTRQACLWARQSPRHEDNGEHWAVQGHRRRPRWRRAGGHSGSAAAGERPTRKWDAKRLTAQTQHGDPRQQA